MSSTHLRLVEALSPTQTSDILIGERSFPADSLLEDEMGLRWFLIESPERVITTHLWSRAVTAGAAAIVTPHRGIWLAITTERFMDLRQEVVGGFYLSQAASNWRPFESFPSYTELLNLPDPTKGTGSPESSDGLDEVDEIGFVNLHNHSEFSALDGMSKAREIVEIVVEQGGKYAAICDHGNCAGHPDLQAACDEAGLKPVFAMEGYLVDDRLRRKHDFTEPAPPKSDAESYEAWKARYDDFMARLRDYWHITLIATDQTGLRNLWAMSTESYRTGLYGNNARLDWEVLAQHSEGVICATGCLRGPLLHKGILDGDEQAALARLARLREIFDDRLYVEIHANTLPEQVKANRALTGIAREQNLPLVAMVDSHYPRKSDYDAHRVWLSVQIKKDVDNEDSDLFGGHQDYHMMSEAEVRESLSYLPDDVVEESIRNTAVIASQATAEVRGTPTPPVYSKGGVEEDEERLLELCLSNWEKTRNKTKSQDEYIARFEREFNLLKKKSFCFTSGTMITMADGTVAPVEKIVPGDLVVTRAGIAPVGRVADRIAQETVRIKIAGGAWPLHTTPDHPFMTPTGWVEAGHLRKGDQVALEQAVAHSGATYDLLAAAQAVGWDTRREGERFARFGPGRWGPRQRKGWCPVAIDLDDDWAYLIGLWVAQGHREVLGTNEGQVSWTLHRNSSSVDRLQQTIRRLGLGEPRLYSKASACQPDHQGVTIKITNHPLWLLLGTLIGDGSKTKMLHPWLVNHPRARLVVDGWFAGDGTVSNSSGQHIVDTANEVLARQGRQIMLRSGEWATTTKFDTPDGEHYRFSWTPNRVKKPYGARWDGQRWWANVVSTERSGEAQVFNLTVAGDPSYVAEDVLVHNCGYFLMTADMTNFARSNGILVGPGRGSGGGSLVAYLSSITDIDPVESDLLFERFMTEGRTELPDFDVDYPASKKQVMQKYVRDRYGEDSTTVVGSVMRLKSKGIIDKLGKAMKDKLPEQFYIDQKAISAIIEDAEADTAGLGLSWKDLQVRAEEELRPYRETYPELFEMAGRLVGRVNTFGQHAAGMVITTDSALTDALPLRRAKEGGHMIAQFDKDVLEQLGFIKFDLLTLTNLDRVQETVDLIREQRGHQVDVYSWRDEYEDPQVWDEIAEAHTLGIFQIETTLGTQYAQRIKPKKLSDLADLVTIVRPGPRNSGLTESYIKRRDGDEEISYPDPRLETVLAKSFGSILYQEDIMQTCMVLAGYDSNEADKVRKILGKKKIEQIGAAGQEFVERAVAKGMQRENAVALWAQMAEFAKYSFNRAHAFAYAVLGYWNAWLKFHYPRESLTVALSLVDKDRIPEFVKETRRMGYQVLPPDVNLSGVGFRMIPGTLDIRYGLDSIKGMGEVAAQVIMDNQPYASYEDFMDRVVNPKGAKVNMGHVALLARVGALDTLVPNRRGLESVLKADKTGESSRCVFKQDTIPVGAPNGLPCGFDWDSEPVPINPRTGKKTKPKPIPKRCTKACRQYQAPPPPSVDDFEPYTDADIRDIEREMLGVFLSSTPFDGLPDDVREITLQQANLIAQHPSPDGDYVLAGIVTKRRPHKDRGGNPMGFVGVETERGTIDVTVFKGEWASYGHLFSVGSFVLMDIRKNSRGATLQALQVIE